MGVIADVRASHFATQELPSAYVPLAEAPLDKDLGALVIRSRAPSDSIASLLRRELLAAAPELPWFDVQALAPRVANSVERWHVGAQVLTAFGVMSIALVALGMYGVLNYVVQARLNDLAIRRCLGAGLLSILRAAALPIASALGTGVFVGLAACYAAAPQVAGLLFETHARNGLLYATVATLVVLIGMLAVLEPLVRAARVPAALVVRGVG